MKNKIEKYSKLWWLLVDLFCTDIYLTNQYSSLLYRVLKHEEYQDIDKKTLNELRITYMHDPTMFSSFRINDFVKIKDNSESYMSAIHIQKLLNIDVNLAQVLEGDVMVILDVIIHPRREELVLYGKISKPDKLGHDDVIIGYKGLRRKKDVEIW